MYDQNNQTQYYNFSRKATVTVKEKNFSPDLVVWNIQGSNQKYQIGEWKNVQGTYVCEISFEEDGRDYSVGLSVTDKAGNKSEWKDRNYFTIDKTAPQISIQINGIGKQANQVPYFNTERIITFANYRVRLTAVLLDKNGSELDGTKATDYIIYTNARIYQDMIDNN